MSSLFTKILMPLNMQKIAFRIMWAIHKTAKRSRLIAAMVTGNQSSFYNSLQWRIYIVKFWTRDSPGSKVFQFHAVFGKIWQNRMLAPPRRVGAPSSGKSWIRHWLTLRPQLVHKFRLCLMSCRRTGDNMYNQYLNDSPNTSDSLIGTDYDQTKGKR